MSVSSVGNDIAQAWQLLQQKRSQQTQDPQPGTQSISGSATGAFSSAVPQAALPPGPSATGSDAGGTGDGTSASTTSAARTSASRTSGTDPAAKLVSDLQSLLLSLQASTGSSSAGSSSAGSFGTGSSSTGPSSTGPSSSASASELVNALLQDITHIARTAHRHGAPPHPDASGGSTAGQGAPASAGQQTSVLGPDQLAKALANYASPVTASAGTTA